MNRATTRGGGGLLSLAQPVEGEESWTTPARARERNFWPNLHARPVPPLSRRDSGFQGCRIGFGYLNCIGIDVDAHGFRRGVINQHLLIRTRVQGGLQPFLFPAKLHCTPRPAPPSLFQLPNLPSLLSLSFSPPPPSLRAKLHRLELIGHLPFSPSSPLIHFSSSNLGFSHANIFQSSLNTVRILYTRRIALFEAKNSLYRKSEERILGKISLHSQMFVLGGGTLTRYSPTPSRRGESRFVTLEGRSMTSRLLKAHPQPDANGSASILGEENSQPEAYSVAAPFTSLLIIRRSLFSVGLSRPRGKCASSLPPRRPGLVNSP